MKVISGKLKGRNIEGFTIDGTRPTMDRVKESLFAMIQEYVLDSVCLDLFAGSGNLGIEAISNYAKECVFVDHNKKAVDTIRKNLQSFSIMEFATIYQMDYLKALHMFIEQGKMFDIIFLDPPYNTDYTKPIMELLCNDVIKDDGLVVWEIDKEDLLSEYPFFTLIKKRKYGDKYIFIYQKCCKNTVN